MEISVDQGAGHASIVALKGKLDIQGAEKIAVPFAAATGAAQNLIVDMTGVTFIASIGIRSLVSSAKAMSRKGGRLVLCGLSEPVHEVLQVSGITDLLLIAKGRDEADRMLAG